MLNCKCSFLLVPKLCLGTDLQVSFANRRFACNCLPAAGRRSKTGVYHRHIFDFGTRG